MLNKSSQTRGLKKYTSRFSDFRGTHKDKTIIVCGCGVSLNTLNNPDQFITIGVNDVGRLFEPDYLVVLNPKHQFKGDRFRYVESSKAKAIFTQLDLHINHPNIIRFRLGVRGGTDISNDKTLPYTKNSPYVAVCLAAYMGASKIGLIGVDFTESHFFGDTGKHALTPELNKMNEEYKNLASVLLSRGVELVNLSSSSRLTALKKIPINEFFNHKFDNKVTSISSVQQINESKIKTRHISSYSKLNIVHISKTNCAGSFWNLHNALNTYSSIKSRVITSSTTTNGLSYPEDVLLSDKRQVAKLIEEADLIHFHNNMDKNGAEMQPYRHLLRNKPAILQFHSEPDVLKKDLLGRSAVNKSDLTKLVVAQKHSRFYPNAIPVPNIVDINNPLLMPKKKKVNNIPIVMYCPTDKKDYQNYKNTCRGKGYSQTLEILRKLELKGVLNLIVRDKVPWKELMHLRANADILIDECVTGGYHITSLEGLSQGLATFAYLDKKTINQICQSTGSSPQELPWVNTAIDSLEDNLYYLANNLHVLKEYQLKARAWMEKYWSPELCIQHYLNIYNKVIDENLSKSSSIPCTLSHNKNKINLKKTNYRINGKRSGRSEDYPQVVRLNNNLLLKNHVPPEESCHILGNGPSIRNVELSLLYDKTIIGVNATPLLHEKLGRSSDYYCVSDRRFFARDNADQIFDLSRQSVRVFAGYCSDFIDDKDINYIKICGGDGVSSDIHQGFYHGCSVVFFASQLAMWLGYKHIYLYGCEFNYDNGRFYKENTIMPFDKHMYPRVVNNFRLLRQKLATLGGTLNIVGPSRLVGDYGSIPIVGIRKTSKYFMGNIK